MELFVIVPTFPSHYDNPYMQDLIYAPNILFSHCNCQTALKQKPTFLEEANWGWSSKNCASCLMVGLRLEPVALGVQCPPTSPPTV